jgi:hypothetical protein
MKNCMFLLAVGTLGLSLWCQYGRGAAIGELDEAPPVAVDQPEGVEVQARGPVHEAFAEPVIRGPRSTPVIAKQPPDPIEELPPDQKPDGDNVKWIPGYWAWDDERNDFLWVSGTWRAVPPDRQWLPGHWVQAEGGWQWIPGLWEENNQKALAFLPPPPDPVVEAVAPAAANTDVFVPGTWVYRDTRYLWRPGFWMAYRPGWVWVPAHYVWTPGGYLFVDGYWDYPLQRRGLLFAPVFIDPRFYVRPTWSYRPSFVVSADFMMGSLFIRMTNNHYYFGDYFEARYGRLGFQAWVDFRVGRDYYDPLYSYYRWQHRDNPSWDRDLRGLYAGRRGGEIPRPPRTLVEQTTVIKNIQNTTVNNTTNVTNIKNVTVLAPLNQLNKNVVKLQPVTTATMAEEKKSVQQIRNLGKERTKVEAQVIAKGSPLAPAAKTPAPVTIDLAHARPSVPAPVATKLPPPPPHPNPSQSSHARTETGKPAPGHDVGKLPEITTQHPVKLPEINPKPPTPAKPADVTPKPAPPPHAPEAQPRPQPRPEPKPMPDKRSDKDKKPPEITTKQPVKLPEVNPKPPAPTKPAEVTSKPAPPPHAPEAQPRPQPRPEPKPMPDKRSDKDKKNDK